MRLALIADLHFGREDPALVPLLRKAILACEPDILVIAGDFVQRARAAHFRPARAFVDSLSAPMLSVPGNHDIPLLNLPARWLRPRAAYRRWIARETEPVWENDTLSLIGVDTTDRWSHQSGRVTARQVRRVCRLIRGAGKRLPVIVAHHPFHQRPEVAKKLMRGAPEALHAWAECGPQIILSGHVHEFFVEPFTARKENGMTLQIHCGTSVSTRTRGAENDFAVLDFDLPRVTVRRMVFGQGDFRPGEERSYVVGASGWSLA